MAARFASRALRGSLSSPRIFSRSVSKFARDSAAARAAASNQNMAVFVCNRFTKHCYPNPSTVDHTAVLSAPETKITTLPNGLRVATESYLSSKTATVGVWIDTVSRFETQATNGTGHFLEHMVFKGTKNRSLRQLQEEIANLGGLFHAYTSREQTAYYAKVMKEDVPAALGVLADILQNSTFSPDGIERERNAILKEMQEVEGQIEDSVFEQLHGIAFRNNPLGRTILGPQENIKSMTRSNLEDYISANYTSPRMGNAHNSRLIMVGDVLKKTNAVFGDAMGDVEDFSCTMRAIKGCNGPISFVLERPVIPVLVQPLISRSTESSFNCGHVAIATWNLNILTSDLKPCQSYTIKEGKVGFAVYTSKFLQPRGLKTLARLRSVKYENINCNDSVDEHASNTYSTTCLSEVGMPYEVIASFSDEPGGKVEWTHGNFPIEEYKHALERAKNDLSYNHSLGMQYTKITKHILVGSCIQTQSDVNNLATNLGITAVLDLQCKSEQVNWGIDGDTIERSFNEAGLVVVKCSIRAAIVWATWDLIAMAEKENHKGPPTHAVQFVWNHGCREGEEVLLVGDFEGWNKPIKALHTRGQNYTVNLRLPQGKYYYKFIVGGHWRHSNSLPSEVDKWGNVNNVITIGDKATANFDLPTCQSIQELTSIKVIERPLTEEERFILAFAARLMAFSICPITLTRKI